MATSQVARSESTSLKGAFFCENRITRVLTLGWVVDPLQQRIHASKRLDEIPFELGLLDDLIDDPTLMARGDPEAAEHDRQTHKRNLDKLLVEWREKRELLGLNE